MLSPRPPGSGVEKILIPTHEIPQDHVLYFIILASCSSQPGIRFFAGRLWFPVVLGDSSPGLSLSALQAPLLFPMGCPTIASKVSHFITIVALHLRWVAPPFPLCLVVSVSWRKRRFLVLLVSRRRFVVSQCKLSLRS